MDGLSRRDHISDNYGELKDLHTRTRDYRSNIKHIFGIRQYQEFPTTQVYLRQKSDLPQNE